MRVCLAQYDIQWENKSANMLLCRRYFGRAAQLGAQLIVFPEMSLTGFTMNTSLAEEYGGNTCRFFSELSAQYNIPCVFGYAERDVEKLYNRLLFADENGCIQAGYAKIHPFRYGGENIFCGGDKPVSFTLGGMEFGMTICYDLRFPELYQQLSKSCGAIIVAASWGKSRREHWLTLLKARAIENQCYILGCNRTGEGGGVSYSGDSVVFAPGGTQAAFAASEECLLIAEIESSRVNSLREEFPVKSDRRIDIYRNFYE